MTRTARLPVVVALTLAAASCGDLELASSALAAPAVAVAAAPASAPTDPVDRLKLLDQLHADLEVAKARAAIAKANADARDAGAGAALAASGAPPMPQFAPFSPGLSFPPIAPPGPSTGKAKGKTDATDAPLFTLVEAWGSGSERQAIIHAGAGDRLVRVGDQIALGVITAISGGAVTYRDAHGRTQTID